MSCSSVCWRMDAGKRHVGAGEGLWLDLQSSGSWKRFLVAVLGCGWVHCAGLTLVLFTCMTRVPIAGCPVSLHFKVAQDKRQSRKESVLSLTKSGVAQVGLRLSFGLGFHW